MKLILLYLSPLLLLFAARALLYGLTPLWKRWQQDILTVSFAKYFFPAFDLLMFFLGIHLFYRHIPFFTTSAPFFQVTIALLIITGTWNIDRFLRLAHKILTKNVTQKVSNEFELRKIKTQVQFMVQIGRFVLWMIGLGMALSTFPQIEVLGSGLLASAGLASVILGLAAQKTITNFIAGLQISLTQPIKIDDVVIVEGEWGRIEEISLTFVVVRIWDLRRLVVPITYFTERPFENWTRSSKNILGTIVFYLDYRVPIATIRQVFLEMVAGHPLWDRDVAGLQVVDTSEKTITVRGLVSASDSTDAWNIRCDLREQMIAYIQEHYPDSLPQHRISK